MKFCNLEFCDNVSLDHLDICSTHYAQQRAGHAFTPTNTTRYREQKVCSGPDCNNVAQSKSLCRAHYLQQYHGSPLTPVKQLAQISCTSYGCDKLATVGIKCLVHSRQSHGRGTCSVSGCGRPHDAKGYCKSHYSQVKRGKEPGTIRAWGIYQSGEITCGVTWCEKPAKSTGHCAAHATKIAKYNLSSEQADYWLGIKACQACGTTTKLCIDHDHSCCAGSGSCGKCVRGVLCGNCNSALGHAKDSADRLQGLISYLQ